MRDLIVGGEASNKMSSLEISELMTKKHMHVMRDIKALIEQEAVGQSNFGLSSYTTEQNKQAPMYLLDFDATMTLITGYDAKRRAVVIKRWRELETGAATPAFQVPQDFPAALRMLANEVEQKQLALSQRDEAIKTKAYISDKKTATAMATASVAVREANKLKDQLGDGPKWKTTRTIPWVNEFFAISKGMWIVLGKRLSALSVEMGLEVRKTDSDRFGKVNTYHIDVIERMRVKLLADENMLGKYRLEEATA